MRSLAVAPRRGEPAPEPDLQHAPLVVGEGGEAAGVVEVEGERLLAQDVHAGREGGLDDGWVERGGRGDQHRLQPGVGQGITDHRVRRRAGHDGGRLGQRLRRRLGQGDDLDLLDPDDGGGVEPAHAPQSDDAQLQRIGHGSVTSVRLIEAGEPEHERARPVAHAEGQLHPAARRRAADRHHPAIAHPAGQHADVAGGAPPDQDRGAVGEPDARPRAGWARPR